MSRTRPIGYLAGAAALACTGGVLAETNQQDLKAQVEALQQKVAELQAANQGDQWLTEQRAAEVRGIVHDVLADADTRASLLQSGMTAGYDDGFMIGSNDGNFSLKLNGQLQVRFLWNNQDDESAEGGDETRYGFENRRTRLIFSGHVVDPAWTYKIQGDFAFTDQVMFNVGDGYVTDDDSGGFNLLDAWIQYDYGNGWYTRVGQFKGPLLREELVHSGQQLAVERSIFNEIFTLDRVQGLLVGYNGDQVRLMGSVHNGARSLNSGAVTLDTEIAAAARAEFLLSGNWAQFEDFTSWQDGEQGWLLGGGVAYERDEFGEDMVFNSMNVEDERLTLTGDVSAEFGGANLFAAVAYADFQEADNNPFGFVVQGGFFVTEDIEIFGRWEYIDFDMEVVGDEDETNIATVGFNRYISDHQLKWTTDFGYAFDPVPAATDVSGNTVSLGGAGFRTDQGDEDGQFVLRSQIQLLF